MIKCKVSLADVCLFFHHFRHRFVGTVPVFTVFAAIAKGINLQNDKR